MSTDMHTWYLCFSPTGDRLRICHVYQPSKTVWSLDIFTSKPYLVTFTDTVFLVKMQKTGKSTEMDLPLRYPKKQPSQNCGRFMYTAHTCHSVPVNRCRRWTKPLLFWFEDIFVSQKMNETAYAVAKANFPKIRGK